MVRPQDRRCGPGATASATPSGAEAGQLAGGSPSAARMASIVAGATVTSRPPDAWYDVATPRSCAARISSGEFMGPIVPGRGAGADQAGPGNVRPASAGGRGPLCVPPSPNSCLPGVTAFTP